MKLRSRLMLFGLCGALVASGLFSALRRHREALPGSLPALEIPETRFSPRQRPIPEENAARDFSNAIADAVQKVMCSVVVVQTAQTERQPQYLKRGPVVFRRFIDRQLPGQGSGVVIDDMGHVLTSWHVVKEVDQIAIVLNDGTRMKASEIGHDAATDLAVLKIEQADTLCPAIEFGDSDQVRVGEVAIAIGSPYSLSSSVTVGHISQKGRRVQILPYEDFIQTDAAINEGNSGGPLIDVDGRLIGINAAVKTEAEKKGTGIGFSVPSNLAIRIAKSIIETGKHEWPWAGCFFETTGLQYRKIFGGASVVISDVFEDTPAARASLQPGTPVLAVDGVYVKDEYDVKRIIFNKTVGDTVRLRLLLNDEETEVELKLEEFPGATTY